MEYFTLATEREDNFEFKKDPQFWLIDNSTDTWKNKGVIGKEFDLDGEFMGYRLPVILVR